MIQQVNLTLEGITVGDFTDEAEVPPEFAHLKPTRKYEVLPNLPNGYLPEPQNHIATNREFTILLKDARVVTVRGDSLRVREAPQHDSLYEITSTVGKKEVVVALFNVLDVFGVFNGKISQG